MRALGEQRVDAFFRADDPHALVLLVLLADLADRVVARTPGLERGGRLEQHPREGGAQERQQRHPERGVEDAPAEPSEDVAPRPQAAERRLLPGALLALELLLAPALLGLGGFLLGSRRLSHRWCTLSRSPQPTRRSRGRIAGATTPQSAISAAIPSSSNPTGAKRSRSGSAASASSTAVASGPPPFGVLVCAGPGVASTISVSSRINPRAYSRRSCRCPDPAPLITV